MYVARLQTSLTGIRSAYEPSAGRGSGVLPLVGIASPVFQLLVVARMSISNVSIELILLLVLFIALWVVASKGLGMCCELP